MFQSCRPVSSMRLHRIGRLLSTYRTARHHSSESAAPYTPPSSSSVSQEEVSHFSKLASSWWDPHGPSRLLHLMNPLRHDFISACLQSDPSYDPNAKLKYLDIGCGGGIFASSAARKPHTESVTAVDPTTEVIVVAKTQQRSDPDLAEPKLTYLNCAIEQLQEQDGISIEPSTRPSNPAPLKQYDIVTLFEVIEHIDTPSAFLETALQHLKPNGWLIGSTISRHPVSYLTTKLIAEAPLIGVVPAGTHDWNKYIKPEELRNWFMKQKIQSDTKQNDAYGPFIIQGVVYIPMLGWKHMKGSEDIGNYFFGVQKLG